MKYKNSLNKLVKSKYGFMLCNRFDKYVGNAIIQYGEYSDDEVELFTTLCITGDNIVEVGSNIGSHTLPLALHIGEQGKLYAFEPQRFIFQTLCANIALNSLNNVFCFQKAVGKKSDILFLPKVDYNKHGNFGGVSLQKDGEEKVDVITLDKYLDIDHLKLLKVDAEGMELDILKGAKKTIKKYRPFLFVENDRFDKHKKLIKYISSLKYNLYWHIMPLYNKNNFFNNSKNIYGELVSANMLCIPKELNIELSNYDKVDINSTHPFDIK